MKVIRLPILAPSVYRDGILLHLTEANPETAASTGWQILTLLASCGDFDAVAAVIEHCVEAASDTSDVNEAVSLLSSSDVFRELAAAPEYIPPKMKVRATGEIGELIYAEGDTMYLWLNGSTRAFPIDQLEPAGY